MKYSIVPTSSYKRSLKRYARSGNFKREKLENVIDLLAAGEKLPKKYKDHALSGNLQEFRECHDRK